MINVSWVSDSAVFARGEDSIPPLSLLRCGNKLLRYLVSGIPISISPLITYMFRRGA